MTDVLRSIFRSDVVAQRVAAIMRDDLSDREERMLCLTLLVSRMLHVAWGIQHGPVGREMALEQLCRLVREDFASNDSNGWKL